MDPAHPGSRFRVRRVDETGSTNADALEAAANGEPEGLVIVADHQTAGRGRLGRTWVAPPGCSLLMSVVLRPPNEAGHLPVCAVGCAAAAASARVAGAAVGLKWPNDLVAGGRKLGGILAEASASSGNVTALVVGLGLNVRLPAELPSELRETATALDQLGAPVTVDVLLAAILDELEPRYARLCAAGPAELIEEYRDRCLTIGQRVRVEQPNETWSGDAVAIDDDAALIVERPGVGRVRVDVGDVVHLRPQ